MRRHEQHPRTPVTMLLTILLSLTAIAEETAEETAAEGTPAAETAEELTSLSETMVNALLAISSRADQQAMLTATIKTMGEAGEETAALRTAALVLRHLDESTPPDALRGYLAAALSADATTRAAAVDAARAGTAPPAPGPTLPIAGITRPEVPQPVAPEEPATMRPSLSPDRFAAPPLPADFQLTETSIQHALRLHHAVPDPQTALTMSLVLGFGTGHFYAHNPQRGKFFLGTQVGSSLLYGVGRIITRADVNYTGQLTGMVIQALSGTAFAASRFADIASAPDSAHRSAVDIINEQY